MESKPFQVWGKDTDETFVSYLVGFSDKVSAEIVLEEYSRAGFTDLEIREIHACPKCDTAMVKRLVNSWAGQSSWYWECPKCKYHQPVVI